MVPAGPQQLVTSVSVDMEGKGGKVPMEPVVKQVNIHIAHSLQSVRAASHVRLLSSCSTGWGALGPRLLGQESGR